MSRTEKRKNPRPNPFDQLMFGPQANSSINYNSKIEDSAKHEETVTNSKEEFNLINTAQTVMETYQQLSPYVRSVSRMFKKFKS